MISERIGRSATASRISGEAPPPPGAVLPEYLLGSAAYRSLSVHARCLLVEIRRQFDGKNNGSIVMPTRTAADLLGCTSATAVKAFADLQDRGFVVMEGQDGGLSGRVSSWSLTDLPMPGKPATNAFLRWRAKAAA